MGVPGPKLMDDEKLTQDFLSICTPTFVTPDTRSNAKLQAWILKGTPLFYFANPRDPHILDGFMQSLWNKTQSNPLGERYWSCVPYLLGEGQAMMYSVYPRSQSTAISRACRCARRTIICATTWRDVVRPGCRVRLHAPAADRSAPDADRERRRALAGEAFALRTGRTAAHSAPEVRTRRSRSPSQTCFPTIRGIACRSTGRWATRAGPDTGCIGSSRGFGRP